MYPLGLTALTTTHPTRIWLVGVSFVLFQFFLQLSSGVVIDAIMHEMKLSAFLTGMLSSSFYYAYTSLQIVVGILFDKQNTRSLLTFNILLCSIGCLLFAHSYTFTHLFLSRLTLGAGAAFAFVGLSHLLRMHFPLAKFAFMIGLSETLGFLVTMLGMLCLGVLISHYGWRIFINTAGIIGFFLAYWCWCTIPSQSPQYHSSPTAVRAHLLTIVKSPKAWINGVFVGLSFTVITVFGAMWAIPFLKIKLLCTLQEASLVDSMMFLGAALSCPLFGKLDNYCSKRRLLMISSCLATALFVSIALYAPITHHLAMAIIFFCIGLCCGAYMLSYTVANEIAPKEALSTCTGFTNTIAISSAPLIQPLIGCILDGVNPSHHYSLGDYQWALLLLPVALLIASILACYLPEKQKVVVC